MLAAMITKYILAVGAAAAICATPLKAGWYSGMDSRGRSWSGWTDQDGYYSGMDSSGRSWSGWVDHDGYYSGMDSQGNSWSGWLDHD